MDSDGLPESVAEVRVIDVGLVLALKPLDDPAKDDCEPHRPGDDDDGHRAGLSDGQPEDRLNFLHEVAVRSNSCTRASSPDMDSC
jgi:hypothetical protein